jgi:hypothetical protein
MFRKRPKYLRCTYYKCHMRWGYDNSSDQKYSPMSPNINTLHPPPLDWQHRPIKRCIITCTSIFRVYYKDRGEVPLCLSTTPWRRKGDVEEKLYALQPRRHMHANDQLHFPAALLPENCPWYPLDMKLMSQSQCGYWEQEKRRVR